MSTLGLFFCYLRWMRKLNPSEERFKQKAMQKGMSVIDSSEEQDMNEHIDFIVDGITYDIKEAKRLRRGDTSTNPDVIWLEMKNVRGDKGWLCSNVDKIAFERFDTFYIVDRQRLLEFTREFVGHGPIYPNPKYKRLYRRMNRKDLITYVYFEDIQHLVENIL